MKQQQHRTEGGTEKASLDRILIVRLLREPRRQLQTPPPELGRILWGVHPMGSPTEWSRQRSEGWENWSPIYRCRSTQTCAVIPSANAFSRGLGRAGEPQISGRC